jgi:hypothetical protein
MRETLLIILVRRARLIRALCRSAKQKAVALMQVGSQKKKASGSFQ